MTYNSFSRFVVLTVIMFSTGLYTFSQNALSVSNTIGADKDSISNGDFVECIMSKNLNSNFSDRLQLDTKNNSLTGRIRLTFEPSKINGSETKIGFRGYAAFTPIKQLDFVFGNSFFNKYALDSFYFHAQDTYENYGKLLVNGIGIQTNIKFQNLINVPLSLKLALGLDIKNDELTLEELNYTFGYSLVLKNVFAIEGKFSNINNKNPLQTSMAINFNFIKSLCLNAGFVNNNYDSDVLLDKTKNIFFLSSEYTFEKIHLTLFADYITGLNKFYISKKGNIKTSETIPYVIASKIEFKCFENTKLLLSYKYADYIYSEENSITSILLSTTNDLDKNNSITAGIRFEINEAVKNENNQIKPNITFPLTWRFQYGN